MKQEAKATLAAMIGYGIFGFSFLFSKNAMAVASPLVLIAVRFLAAFLLLNLLLLTPKASISLKGKPVGWLLLLGLIQPVAYFICESYGIAMTTAAFSGIMIGLGPVVGLVFGVLFLKEKCTLFQAVCTLLSVAGVAMTTTGGLGTVPVAGFLLLLGAVVCAALFTIISRKTAQDFTAFERSYVMFALGSALFTILALAENRADLAALAVPLTDGSFWIAIAYLAAASSVCAFLCINYATTYLPAARTMIFSNCVPVISALAGIFIMGDTFTWVQLLGMAIIVASVFGVSKAPKK